MNRSDPAPFVLVLALWAAAPLPAGAADPPTVPRPRIGLALAGGGVRGGAHIGVLRVLEELRVPVDCVAGTSVGSIVGGLYAVGYAPDEIGSTFAGIDWPAIFRDDPERRRISFRRKEDDDLALFPLEIGVGRHGFSWKSGVVSGVNVDFVLRGLTLRAAGVDDFDRLNLPYRAVASDLQTGQTVVLGHGDLVRAMRASMALPGVFTPVEIDGRLLVDGGVSRNLPVDVVREMGAERVIAVNVGTPPRAMSGRPSAASVLSQTLTVLSEHNVTEQIALLSASDVLITPELDQISTVDFDKMDQAIAAGEAAARLHEAQLRRLSVSEEEYAAFRAEQRRGSTSLLPETPIDEIVVRGVPRMNPERLTRRMRTRPGQPLKLDDLQRDLARVAQAGEFESVGFHQDERDGLRRLVIEAQEKSWGPGYLRFGVGFESSFDGDSNFRLIGNYRQTGLNRLGAEWKTNIAVGDPSAIFTELFQPLEPTARWFVAPSLYHQRRKDETFVDAGGKENVDRRDSLAGFDLGRQFFNWGEVRLGLFRGRTDLNVTTTSALPDLERDRGGARLAATLDHVDNVFFPTHGNLSRLEFRLSRRSLGADDEYERLALDTLHAWTWGKNTFVGKIDLGTDLGSGLPVYDAFELGGFLNLSGFGRGQLRGNASALFTLADYWRFHELGPLGKLYVGAAGQAGNVWADAGDAAVGDLIYSGTLFFGLDSPLAPVYVGYGRAESGEDSFYLFVGRPF